MSDRLYDALEVCRAAMATGVEMESALGLYPDLAGELRLTCRCRADHYQQRAALADQQEVRRLLLLESHVMPDLIVVRQPLERLVDLDDFAGGGKRPPAIAFNIDSLKQAEQAGAVTVRVIDLDSGIIYQSTIRHIWEKGVEIDRGYGRQVYLPLNGWIKSMPGSASQLAWAF